MDNGKIWIENTESGIKIIRLTKAYLNETLKLMRESFYTDEPPAKGVELQKHPDAITELEKLTVDTMKDNASVIAIKDDKVIGASFNKIQHKPLTNNEIGYFENYRDNICKTSVAKEYIDCMIRMDEKVDIFKHYKVDRILEVMFLTTSREYRCQGIGQLLVEGSIKVAKELKLELITSIFTSKGSQKIGEKLKWDKIIKVPMSEHIFNNKPYNLFTGEHDSQILVAYKI